MRGGDLRTKLSTHFGIGFSKIRNPYERNLGAPPAGSQGVVSGLGPFLFERVLETLKNDIFLQAGALEPSNAWI